MADINWSSIEKKLNAYIKSSEGQSKIRAKTDEYMIKGKSGGKTPPDNFNPEKAAKRFIEILRDCIDKAASLMYGRNRLGPTAVDALKEIKAGAVVKEREGEYSIPISFSGERHRESLAPDEYPDGVEDIVVILNNGYPADGHRMGIVFGKWHGKEYKSLPNRQGTYFIQEAAERFMKEEAAKYGVKGIEINEAFKR